MSIRTPVGLSAYASSSASERAQRRADLTPFSAFLAAVRGGAEPASPGETCASNAVAPPPAAEAQALASASQRFSAELDNLQDTIAGVLDGADIDLSPPITLGLDARGQLQVQDDHPDRVEIESALAACPELAAAFGQLEQQYQSLQPADAATPYGLPPRLQVTVGPERAPAAAF